jgi:hypothetical protein
VSSGLLRVKNNSPRAVLDARAAKTARLAACFSACSIGVGITLVDVGPTQEIVEAADPVPSVAVAF